jgi:hypothetical protein
LSQTNKDSYVFADSNVDLLRPNSHELAAGYVDVGFSNGFIQLITKATRIQGTHSSLIDHVFTNVNSSTIEVGTIIHDISDHFMNFVKIPHVKHKICTKPLFKRNFNNTNVTNFKNDLGNLSWINCTNSRDVNLAFDLFWTDFKMLFDLHFPLRKFKFNINKHKLQKFFTNGLLISRQTILELCKKAAKEKTDLAFNNYKKYRNLYNTVLKASKKLYFNYELKNNVKNPKKTWEVLKEAANLTKTNSSIDKINGTNGLITNPTDIANKFNDFFY